MLARVYIKDEDRFFRSVVYATVRSEGRPLLEGLPEQFYHDEMSVIVYDPKKESFILVPHEGYHMHDNSHTSMNIPKSYYIEYYYYIYNDQRVGWGKLSEETVEAIDSVKNDYSKLRRILSVEGYPEIIEKFEFIATLINGKSVSVIDAGIELREPDDSNEWNYITCQKDADELLRQFYDFHEATVKSFGYEAEGWKGKRLNLVLKQGYNAYENPPDVLFCFEGVMEMLYPSFYGLGEGNIPYIHINVTEADVFFGDDEIDCLEDLPLMHIDKPMYFYAMSVKWKLLE